MNDSLQKMQSNNNKQKWREKVNEVIEECFSHMRSPIRCLSLPSTDWKHEKMMLAEMKKKGICIQSITGVENQTYKMGHPKQFQWIFPDVVANAPTQHGTKILVANADFDRFLKNHKSDFNLVLADYCGYPLKIKFWDIEGRAWYTYPHVDSFIDYAKSLLEKGESGIWIANFNCNLRIEGGQDDAIRAMGGSKCKTMQQAINNRFITSISANGLTGKVHRIVTIYYQGCGKTFMYTIGFAIGFNPIPKEIKQDWTKPAKHVPISMIGLSPAQKAWVTRRANAEAKKAKNPIMVAAGHKAYATRLLNLKKILDSLKKV